LRKYFNRVLPSHLQIEYHFHHKTMHMIKFYTRGQENSWLRMACFAILSFCFLMVSSTSYAQQAGDFRSVNSGKWSAAIWEKFDGTNWIKVSDKPALGANARKVTIRKGHIVDLTFHMYEYGIDSLELYGTLKIVPVAVPMHLNAHEVNIYPDPIAGNPLNVGGAIRWDYNAVGLRIPYNSSIAYPPTYRGIEAVNSENPANCGDNIGLYLGGGHFGQPEVQYATCKGQLEGVCLSFANVNEVGGIIRTVPIIPIPVSVGDGNQSCELEFETTVTVLGVPKDAIVSIAVYGESGPYIVSSVPQVVTGITDGGPNDLDNMVNGEVIFPIKFKATGYAKFPVVIAVNKGYSPSSPAACRDFGLLTTDTVDFEFLAPPTLDINVPTAVCGGSGSTADFTNPSTENYIGVFWSLNDVPQQPFVVDPGTTYSLNIPVSGSGTAKLTVNQLSYASPSPVFPCANVLNMDYMINAGAASALAIDQDQNTQQVFGGVDIAASTGCRLIASLVSPQISSVQAKAFVANGVISPSGRPVVGRRVWMKPATGTSTIYDKVTLYALQSEFDAFNAATPDGVMIPVDALDPQNYKANIRVFRFDEGEYDPATGLPTVGIGQATIIDPASMEVKWNLSHGFWEISFPSTPLGLFIIGNENFVILPLKLLDFEAKLVGKSNVDLTWKTTEERDVRGFDVEVSATGTDFRKVGFVNARNVSGEQTYSFATMMPSKLGYFRLKMIDNNGEITYGPVRMLKAANATVQAYPNPAHNQISIDLSGFPGGQLRMLDMSGRVISVAKTVDGMNKINTQHLANGIYVLEVKLGTETELIKVSVIHQ